MVGHGCRCLVTGAAGFVGSHLAERLVRAGANVRALVHYRSLPGLGNIELIGRDARDALEIVPGDITDSACIDQAVTGCDVVFHLAAIISIPASYEMPDRVQAVNSGGTLNLLNACRRHGVRRVVHTSSSEVYGSAREVPMRESHPLCAQSPYAASKISADALATAYWRSYGVPVVIVRPFNTYGPRQSTRAVLTSIVAQLVSGADHIELGDLRPTRDLVYVDDTVSGFVAAAEAAGVEGLAFNLATGRETSVGELARIAMDAAGRVVPIRTVDSRRRPVESEVTRLCGDASAARELLSWVPSVGLEEGIARLVEHERAHPRPRPAEQVW
jgi:NAD dependent epimerase/dehydratase